MKCPRSTSFHMTTTAVIYTVCFFWECEHKMWNSTPTAEKQEETNTHGYFLYSFSPAFKCLYIHLNVDNRSDTKNRGGVTCSIFCVWKLLDQILLPKSLVCLWGKIPLDLDDDHAASVAHWWQNSWWLKASFPWPHYHFRMCHHRSMPVPEISVPLIPHSNFVRKLCLMG